MLEPKHLLRNAKLKVTLPRLTVLKILQESPKELTAIEIFECALSQLDTMSFATIYHILRLLESVGLINKFKYGNGQALYSFQHQAYCMRLRCKHCGSIQQIQNQNMNQKILDTITQYNTQEYSLIIQLNHCSQCRSLRFQTAKANQQMRISRNLVGNGNE